MEKKSASEIVPGSSPHTFIIGQQVLSRVLPWLANIKKYRFKDQKTQAIALTVDYVPQLSPSEPQFFLI